jgi:phage gpG-like protein
MAAQQNKAKLKKLENEFQALFASGRLQKIVGTEAVNHYQEAFQEEGFADKSDYPNTDVQWEEVKRRSNPRKSQKGKASSKRKILTGETGDLGDGFYYDFNTASVTIKNPAEYAKIQNEGGKAGRNLSATIPARKFMGASEVLTKKILKKFEKEFNKVLK